MKNNRIAFTIAILSGVGALISLYLLWNHYTVGPSFCKIGGAVNCDLVNRGPYGEILGFPVSGIGLLGYLLLGVLALAPLFLPARQKEAVLALRISTTIALLFSLYLLYLELFVLFAICPFCMVSLLLITVITTLAWVACPAPNRWSNGSGAGVDPPSQIT
ncbi:hypothetical protein HY625_00450 [Candidatus Uhrbacteria bacterium]|nr:hypothetical protein [Candidatus Uhrbacteria bacterium]